MIVHAGMEKHSCTTDAPRSSHRSTCASFNDFMLQSERCTHDPDSCDPGDPVQTAAADSVVTLSVGGTQFTTTIGTLTAVTNSYFSTLFGSQRWAPSVFVPGSQTPFIDRDPESFQYVLSYLRHLRYADSQLILPESTTQLKRLQAEAEYYGLPGLVQACSLGRWASGVSFASFSRNAQQQQPAGAGGAQMRNGLQAPSSMYREPTFSMLQQRSAGGSSSASRQASGDGSLKGALQATWDELRQHPQVQCSAGGAAAGTPVSGEDVQISMQQHQLASCVAHCICTAQQTLAAQQQVWAANSEWQLAADLVLKHLLHLPLAAQQPDLVSTLSDPKLSTRLQFLLQYYPVGDLRIELECRIVPDAADAAATVIAAAAAAGANAVVAGSSPSPHLSPRDNVATSRAGSGGSAAGILAAAAAAATAAATGSRPPTPAPGEAAAAAAALASSSSSSSGVTPGPGWGGVTAYHRYSIRETSEKFVMATHMPGEALQVEEAARAHYKQELKAYSTLHKLLVQQAPRSSVAGLMWLLESAGFSSVKLSTLLDTYYVGSNAFPGFKSVITFEL